MHDIAIIGAGPAGSAAAVILARSGRDVLLIEQHRFPRDKVCGECISSLGIDVLNRLGVGEILQQLQPAILQKNILHSPDGAMATIPLPRRMWGLSRKAMDAALLDEAKKAGAKVFQPARVESLEPGSPVKLVIRDLQSNDVRTIESRWVILADGKAALLADRPSPTTDLGIKGHFKNVDGPSDAIELFGVSGHYGGLAQIEGGVWNAAFSVPASRAAEFRGDFDSLLQQMIKENIGLKHRLGQATRVSPWLASPLPRHGISRVWPAGIIPVGNAAAALEPIGGEGMGLALASAELAAEAIIRGIESPADIDRLSRKFDRLWRVRRATCRALAVMMSHPLTADLTVPAAASAEGLSRLVIRSMGKS